MLDGQEMIEVNGPFKRFAQRRGFWSQELARRLAGGQRLAEAADVDEQMLGLFVTAHEIAPEWHVRMQAAFQEHVDGAISKTINLPADATPADVDGVYRLAYELGCKGVTVYRHGCRGDQPMALEPAAGCCPRCRAAIADESGCSRCPQCGATLCS